MMRKIIVAISTILFVAVCFLIYFKATYIDNKVASGEAYGFKIGDTQEETYRRAQKAFGSNVVFILDPLNKNGYGPHKKFYFTEEEYVLLSGRTKWEFFFDEGFFDFIALIFKNGKLTSIYRHRQKFELP